jgi:hypothetical protein
MNILKITDGFFGQIILLISFCIYQWFQLDSYLILPPFRFLVFAQKGLILIMWPVEWFINASIEISPLLGIGGLLLGAILVGFIYGIVFGSIIRSIAILVRAIKKPKPTL